MYPSIKPRLQPRYSVQFMTPDEVEQSFDVLPAWQKLLAESMHLYRLWQSPEWWNHLGCLAGEMPRRLGVVRDGRGAITGIAPVQVGDYGLRFELGRRTLWRVPLRTVFLLGSQPLLPDDDRAYRQLFTSVWDAFPDCNAVHMMSLVKTNWCWRYVEAAGDWDIQRCFPYAQRGVRQVHSIALPATFDDYLKKFCSRRRKEFRKKVQRLTECGGGRLKLERIDSPQQVDCFLSIARSLYDRSWKGKCRLPSCLDDGKVRLADLAQRGILRAYLLWCGEACCASFLGFQYGDVFSGIEIAHDPAYDKYSPGTVLLLLLIEDLARHAPPQRISLGHGDQEFKARFGTDHDEEASLVLLRDTLTNRLKYGCHRAFRSSLQAVKHCLGRHTPG